MLVYKRVWNSNKIRMAMTMLGPAASAVPIGDIFSDKTPEHVKSQTFHRTVFVWTYEKVFEHRNLDDDKTAAFKFFKTMMGRPQFGRGPSGLDSGGAEKIPVKWGSFYDDDRRIAIEMTGFSSGFGIVGSDEEGDGEEETDD